MTATPASCGQDLEACVTQAPRPSGPLRPSRLLALLLTATAAATTAATASPAVAGDRSSPEPASAAAAASLPAGCAAPLAAERAQETRLRHALPRLDALLLAEIHTSTADHTWQLRTLEAVIVQRPDLSLALEMVPSRLQPVLDRWSAGQLREDAFLEQVEWARVWGHDPDLYLPLLRWARQRRVPLLALNAEPELVKRVRSEGLAAIPPARRDGIGTPAPPSAAYRQRLSDAWLGHGGGQSSEKSGDQRGGLSGAAPPWSASQLSDLQRFIDSQLLRDRAMAEAIAAAHRRDPTRLVVALIGSGHLEGQDGVPHQLSDLGLSRQLSLSRIPLPAACRPAPAGARLGAYLESADGAVWVRQVAPGSAAAAAGLRPGDRILELDGRPVDHAGQVIRGVRLHPDGVPLRLTLERAGRRLRLELRLPPRREPRLAARGWPKGTMAGGVAIGDAPPTVLITLSPP